MNAITLVFKNKTLEEKYQKDTSIVRHFEFYRFIVIEMILALITIATKLSEFVSTSRIIILIMIIFLNFLIIYIGKKYTYRKYTNKIFLSIHICIHIIFVEMIIFTFGNTPEFYLICLIESFPIFICLNTMVLVKIKWFFQSIINFSFHIYFVVRIFDLDLIKTYPEIVVFHFICAISFLILAYSTEKTLRKLYERVMEGNSLLNDYSILLKNIMPSPIILINVMDKKIVFKNNSANEFMSSYSQIVTKNNDYDKQDDLMKLYNILHNFKVLSNCNQNGENLIFEILSNSNPSSPKSNNLFDLNDTKAEDLPIYQLENIEKLIFIQKQLCFSEKKNVENLKTNESLKNKKYFNFKFLKLNWLNKESLLLIIDDISDIHKLEELKNLDNYKDQLLATVSHDLRTPLNGMMGLIETAVDNINIKKDKKNLSIALRSGKLLLSMINDILDFSQINHKKLRLTLFKIDLIEIIKQTYKLIKFQAKSKCLNLTILIKDNIEKAIVYSDSHRIQQILLNLLNNSLKFTKTGDIKIVLEKIDSEEESLFKIMVEDSGIGISDDDKSKLFKLFSKLENNIELNATGVGLGLTISKNLALLLNNDSKEGIYLESDLGKGSKFWFFIKNNYLETPANERSLLKKSYESNFEFLDIFQIKKKIKVLLVDDDMINIKVTSEYCKYFNIDFIIANDGKESISIIEEDIINNKKNIDAIFMDINMPFIDGYQASMKINKILKENNQTIMPIIAMTANVIEENNQNFIKSGMTGFILKPVSRLLFGQTLKQYLNI